MSPRKPQPNLSQRKQRACLGPNCKGTKKFLSDHPGHRLCKHCAARANRFSGTSNDAAA
jgi:hypothetical protein